MLSYLGSFLTPKIQNCPWHGVHFKISSDYFSLSNTPWSVIHCIWKGCLSACVYGPGTLCLLWFLPLFADTVSLISLLYPVLSVHISPSFDIWVQIRYDIDISNLYALNYLCLCLSRWRPPCYRSCVVGNPLLPYRGVFSFSTLLLALSYFLPPA